MLKGVMGEWRVLVEERDRGGEGREGDEGQGEKGDGSYQQVFNHQLREPK